MAGSLLNKNTVLHAIAITITIAIFSGQIPLNHLFPAIPRVDWHLGGLSFRPE